MTRRRQEAIASQITHNQAAQSRSSAVNDLRFLATADQQLLHEFEGAQTQYGEKPAGKLAIGAGASLDRLKRAEAKVTRSNAKESINARTRTSGRPVSVGKKYDLKEIFDDQLNGSKVDFETAPSQWANGDSDEEDDEEPDTINARLRASRKAREVKDKPTPAVSPQKHRKQKRKDRGRPRKNTTPASSAALSPLAARTVERQKRQRDQSPERAASKRAKTASQTAKDANRLASARHKVSDSRVNESAYSLRGRRDASVALSEIVETEVESDAEVSYGPTADQEVELGEDLDSARGSRSRTTRSSQRNQEDSGEIQPRQRTSRKRNANKTRKQPSALEPVVEESVSSARKPKTPPEQIVDEDAEVEEEELQQDSEDDDSFVPKNRKDGNPGSAEPEVSTIANEAEGTEETDDEEEVGDKHSDEDGVEGDDESKEKPRQSARRNDQTQRSTRDGKKTGTKTSGATASQAQSSTKKAKQQPSSKQASQDKADHDATAVDSHRKYIDLEETLTDLPQLPNTSSHNPKINESTSKLMNAARDYRNTLEMNDFLENYEPVKKHFKKCSKSLRALYDHIVDFIDLLGEDFAIENDTLSRRTWVDLDQFAEKLRQLVKVVEHSSKYIVSIYGLFSMVALVAVAYRFQQALEAQVPKDLKWSLELLQNVVQTYDLMHNCVRDRELEDEPAKTLSAPIYKTLFAMRQHVSMLAHYTTRRLALLKQQEANRRLLEAKERSMVLDAERQKMRDTIASFDVKRNRLLALWNCRQEQESNIHLRLNKFGSAQISEYWRMNMEPNTGYVQPREHFDWAKLAFSTEEIASLEGALKQHYKLGPYKMWNMIFEAKCGYYGSLKTRTVDQLLNVAKFLKQYYLLEEGFGDEFWTHVPDLDLCDLLPMRR